MSMGTRASATASVNMFVPMYVGLVVALGLGIRWWASRQAEISSPDHFEFVRIEVCSLEPGGSWTSRQCAPRLERVWQGCLPQPTRRTLRRCAAMCSHTPNA